MKYYIQSDSDGNQIAFIETESIIVDEDYEQISEAEYHQGIAELLANLPEPEIELIPDENL